MSEQAEPDVVVDRSGGVCVIRLRTVRTAQCADRSNARHARGRCSKQTLTRDGAIVITGAGDKAFCAGMDLRAFAAAGDDSNGGTEATEGFLRLLRASRHPVDRRGERLAPGGGFELMLACDIVVTADHAPLRLPEVKRGLIAGGTGVLPGARLRWPVALEIRSRAEPIAATPAYAARVVNHVVPGADVLSAPWSWRRRWRSTAPPAVVPRAELCAVSRDVAAAEQRSRTGRQWCSQRGRPRRGGGVRREEGAGLAQPLSARRPPRCCSQATGAP